MRRPGYAGPLVAFALLAVVPLVVSDPYLLHVLALSLIFGVLASSWNLVAGYAGIFTFGHHAFFGLGAYVSALLAMRAGLSPWVTLLAAGGAAGLVSLFIGLPVLRLRAVPYVAIVTLGFAEIARVLASNLVELTRGQLGLWGIPALPSISMRGLEIAFTIADRRPHFYLLLLVLAALWLISVAIDRSPVGLAIRAVRESQDAAESIGINPTGYKMLVFFVSSFFAGFAGAIYAHYTMILTPSAALSSALMVEVLAMTLVGGMGTLFGPLLGAFVLTVGLEYLRFLGEYRLLVYGLLLVGIMHFAPKGILPPAVAALQRVWKGLGARQQVLLGSAGGERAAGGDIVRRAGRP